jgi:hypothetical protein
MPPSFPVRLGGRGSPPSEPGGGPALSASTKNQALSALLFLYRELLERDLELEGVVGLLYGSGLRMMCST